MNLKNHYSVRMFLYYGEIVGIGAVVNGIVNDDLTSLIAGVGSYTTARYLGNSLDRDHYSAEIEEKVEEEGFE
ncbi:MAG: hypothetical protein HYX24_06825 [Candidatus Aenigmarchaeota archaeon]|nr:hypothetical protein [Candidatus Aenigmarchaeota archaeon]